jgi:aspartyl-tRNA synthetase
MELAFTDREGIMGLMEGLIATAFREVLGVEVRLCMVNSAGRLHNTLTAAVRCTA